MTGTVKKNHLRSGGILVDIGEDRDVVVPDGIEDTQVCRKLGEEPV